MPVSEVFCTDCYKYMQQLPANFISLAIVDTPYGIGQTWSKSRTDRFYHSGKLRSYKNDKRPPKQYFKELFRISKNRIIWGGNYFTDILPVTNAWIIWNKKGPITKMINSDAELAWTSFRRVMKVVDLPWAGAIKCEKVDKIHPYQKPVELYKWLLKTYAKPGDIIFDSHMGSQSSRIAAYELGFDYYGCELDPDYFREGCARFDAYRKQKEEIAELGYAKSKLEEVNPTLFN